MELPAIPFEVFIITALGFIVIIIFTCFRYNLSPNSYIGHGTVFASLVIGFVLLYAMQKYDKMDANIPVVERNIIYLTDKALLYDPSLVCYLSEYLSNFLNFQNDRFPLVTFEAKLLPHISDDLEIFRIREAVTTLEDISYQRITKSNLIPNLIWYLVYITAFFLTIIFPMDSHFEKELDSIIVLILIWLPVLVIYYLYVSELNRLDDTISQGIEDLDVLIEDEGLNCPAMFAEDARIKQELYLTGGNNGGNNGNNNNKCKKKKCKHRSSRYSY